jgi:transposase-like protein
MARGRSAEFSGRHFEDLIILQALRWYLKYPISYRQLAEILLERGVEVDHTTLYRWVQKYSPEFEKKLRWYSKPLGFIWHVDKTYIKVKGEWRYLYRAIDVDGKTIDFYLSRFQNTKAAVHFFTKLLSATHEHPSIIYTDKHPSLRKAITTLQYRNIISLETEHITTKVLNNRIESDHFRIKRLTRPMLGFKSFNTAKRCIKGLEDMLMVTKKQVISVVDTLQQQINFIHKLFGIYQV